MSLVFSLAVFLFSFMVSPFYIGGDQLYYIDVYEVIHGMPLNEAFVYYNLNLSSYEPIHFILYWVFGGFLDKHFLMSLFNAFFVYYASRLMLRIGARPLIVLLVIFLSYYPHVLFFSAERLKIAFFFFFISFWYMLEGRRFLLYFYAIFSVLTHVQLIISWASILFLYLLKSIKPLLYFRVKKNIIFLMVVSIPIFFLMIDHMIYKAGYYFNGFDSIDLLKFLIIYFLALFYSGGSSGVSSKSLIIVTALFFPLFIVTIIMGSSRTLFFGYFIFLYFALQKNGGLNFGILITLIYGSYKSFEFIFNTIFYGVGVMN